MTYSVHLLSRDFSQILNVVETITAQTLSWSCLGGPDEAILQAPTSILNFKDWKEFLGHPVEIFNETGHPVWWGYINRIRQPFEPFTLQCGLDPMANSVAVRYTDLLGDEHTTPWASDALSVSRFGIKQKIIDVVHAGEPLALQKRDLLLSQLAWPSDEIASSNKPITDSNHFANLPVFLDCKGWFETLSWKYYPGQTGIIGNTVSQNGSIPIGSDTSHAGAAQRFLATSNMTIATVKLRASYTGSPPYTLAISIRTDAGGVPSSQNLARAEIPRSALASGSYKWAEAPLTVPVSLQAGQRYWVLVFPLNATYDSNHWLLALDESCSFNDIFIYMDNLVWVSPVPNAHMLFQVAGLSETTTQLNEVYAVGNQFLTALVNRDPSGVQTPLYHKHDTDCKTAFLDLLALGNSSLTPYMAFVDRNRTLSVLPQPPKQAQFQLDSHGRLTDLFSHPLSSPHLAVGCFMSLSASAPFFVSSLTLKTKTGQIAVSS